MRLALAKIIKALKTDGVFYASLKIKRDQLLELGRKTTYYSKEDLIDLFEVENCSHIVDLLITRDTGKRNIDWANIISKKL